MFDEKPEEKEMRVTEPPHALALALEEDLDGMRKIPLEEIKEENLKQTPMQRKASSHDGQQKSGSAKNLTFLQVPGSSEYGQTEYQSTAQGSNLNSREQSESKSFARPSGGTRLGDLESEEDLRANQT